jgi:hypothetical protein
MLHSHMLDRRETVRSPEMSIGWCEKWQALRYGAEV